MEIDQCFKCFKFPKVFDIKGVYYVMCDSCDAASADFDKNKCYRKWNSVSGIERLHGAVMYSGALKISEFI